MGWRINESAVESETVYGRIEKKKKNSMDLSGQTKNWWAEVANDGRGGANDERNWRWVAPQT